MPQGAPGVYSQSPLEQLNALLRYRLPDPLEDAFLEYAEFSAQSVDAVRAAFDAPDKAFSMDATGQDIRLLDLLVSPLHLPHLMDRLQVMLALGVAFRGASFLDLGAGSGRDCIAFARSGLTVTHADIPWEGMEFARWRYAQRGLRVRCVDARELPPERFTLIGCHDVFEHVEDPVELMVQWVAHLAPNGLLFASLDLFNPIPTHLPKNDFYATFYHALLQHLGLNLALGHSLHVNDVSCARMRVYQRARPALESFAEEVTQIRQEAYAFAERALGDLRKTLDAEHDRVRALATPQPVLSHAA